MNATRLRIVGEMLARFVAWAVLAIAQLCVIGMWIDARYPRKQSAEPSPLFTVLWALAWPVLFLASLAPFYWRNRSETLDRLGGVYALIGGLIVFLLTGAMLFG